MSFPHQPHQLESAGPRHHPHFDSGRHRHQPQAHPIRPRPRSHSLPGPAESDFRLHNLGHGFPRPLSKPSLDASRIRGRPMGRRVPSFFPPGHPWSHGFAPDHRGDEGHPFGRHNDHHQHEPHRHDGFQRRDHHRRGYSPRPPPLERNHHHPPLERNHHHPPLERNHHHHRHHDHRRHQGEPPAVPEFDWDFHDVSSPSESDLSEEEAIHLSSSEVEKGTTEGETQVDDVAEGLEGMRLFGGEEKDKEQASGFGIHRRHTGYPHHRPHGGYTHVPGLTPHSHRRHSHHPPHHQHPGMPPPPPPPMFNLHQWKGRNQRSTGVPMQRDHRPKVHGFEQVSKHPHHAHHPVPHHHAHFQPRHPHDHHAHHPHDHHPHDHHVHFRAYHPNEHHAQQPHQPRRSHHLGQHAA